MRETVRQQMARGLFVSLAVVAPAAAQSGSAVLPMETILERMAQARAANRAQFRSYVVTRSYTLFGRERDESKSEVTAEITFVPPNSKQFRIQESTGSGLGERLVRRMLEGEMEIVENYGETDISADNYEFRFAGEQMLDSRRCYVLEMSPKRKRGTLLRGSVWVDVSSYRLHRVEGEPAKSPSWWLRNLRIAFSYSEVAGMWLQTASEYTTNVRIFGPYTMTSRDLGYETAPAGGGPTMLLPANEHKKQDCAAPCVPVALEQFQPGSSQAR